MTRQRSTQTYELKTSPPAEGPAKLVAWVPELRASSDTFLKVFMSDYYYAPFLMRGPVKAAVLLLFVAYFVLSCIAFPNLTEGQPLQDLAPGRDHPSI